MRTISNVVAVLLLAVPCAFPGAEPPAPTAEELAERERIRPVVEGALADLREPADRGEPLVDQHDRVVRTLAGLGAAVVPFLAAELDLPDQLTFAPAACALGHVGTPAAVDAIRKALAAADLEGGGFGRYRKKWCVYALALSGDARSIEEAAGGTTPVDWMEFMEGMRVADVAASLTTPASRSVLWAQVDRYRVPPDGTAGPTDERAERLIHAVRALSWVGDAESVSRLAGLLSHPATKVRLEAVAAIARIGGPAALDPLLKALDAPEAAIRAEAVGGLLRSRPPRLAKELLTRLETEQDIGVRTWIYRAVAAIAPADTALEAFRSHRDRVDPADRAALARAVGETGDRSGLNLLRLLLRDPVADVAVAAAHAIHAIGGEGATDTLLALIADPRPPVAQSAVEILAESGEGRAAPRIAETLLRAAARTSADPSRRAQLLIRAEALVRLKYSEPADDLRKAAERQSDPADRDILEDAADRLTRIAECGDDSTKWAAVAASAVPADRALAFRRLSEIADAKAVSALLEALDRAAGGEEAAVLEALARTGASEAEAAFALRLTGPAWDAPARADARGAAAFGARRVGTPAMIDALEAAARRRDGIDFAPLAYLAVVAPERAAPLIRRVLPTRLRRYHWDAGREQAALIEIVAEIEAGRSAARWDVPPGRYHRH